jgi:hypothetical protein
MPGGREPCEGGISDGRKLGLDGFGIGAPFGTAGAATARFQSLGGGAAWYLSSSSLLTRLGRKCPAFDFLRFSYLRSSTKVIMTMRKTSSNPRIMPNPISEPFTQYSSCHAWNFTPY